MKYMKAVENMHTCSSLEQLKAYNVYTYTLYMYKTVHAPVEIASSEKFPLLVLWPMNSPHQWLQS